jgi:hypothetical protein
MSREDAVETIPMPEVLDPDRMHPSDADPASRDDEDRAATLTGELRRTCEYARSLWDQLQNVREYLVASLPDGPDPDGARARTSATPTGTADDEGWQRWTATYAAVTAALAGPQGDSGYGAQEAQLIAQHRRAARSQ